MKKNKMDKTDLIFSMYDKIYLPDIGDGYTGYADKVLDCSNDRKMISCPEWVRSDLYDVGFILKLLEDPQSIFDILKGMNARGEMSDKALEENTNIILEWLNRLISSATSKRDKIVQNKNDMNNIENLTP